MKEKINNKLLQKMVDVHNKFAISQVNSVCHYIYYQEEEANSLEKYKRIRNTYKKQEDDK